jgi:hypothetical protein
MLIRGLNEKETLADTTQRSEQRSPLQTNRGITTISDAVVTSIAAQVVREVSGAEPEIGGRDPARRHLPYHGRALQQGRRQQQRHPWSLRGGW